jgi:hypothetical protein
LAFEALRRAQDTSKPPSFGDVQGLALIVTSTLATAAVLQSFALKIGDRSIVDVSKVVGDFRAAVLEGVSRQQARMTRETARLAAEKLEDVFKGKDEELRRAFVSVMSFAGRTPEQVHLDLVQIGEDADALEVEVVKLLAQRIAQTDVGVANNLYYKVNKQQG